ncbi:MAG: LytTR family DNA-binding domain-containing protein [Niabella sp.]
MQEKIKNVYFHDGETGGLVKYMKLWTYIKDKLHQPHPGYSDLGVYFRTIAGIATIVFLMLSIFQPFNLGHRNINGNPYLTAFVYAGSALITMFASSLWMILFPRWFSEERWTLRSEILIIIYQMGSIAVTVWVINQIRGVMLPGISSYLRVLLMVFSTGIIPYTMVAFIRHNYLLKRNLEKARLLTGKLQSEKEEKDIAALVLPGLKEKVLVSELYYVESKGNYLNLLCEKEGAKYSLLCRCTMKEFESACAKFSQLFRCHRSFIVNLNKVLKVEGNAGGYFLHLLHNFATVPVSRTYIEEFKKKLTSRSS